MSDEETRTHSALHVLKGAAAGVLGVKWTASTYAGGKHGRLTVKLGRKPTEEELARVEAAANDKVSEGAEVIEFEMDRDEAERHWGDAIYDVFPVPSGVTRLKLVRISDWNVNCCTARHVENTREVGRITLGKPRFRAARGELELEFDVA